MVRLFAPIALLIGAFGASVVQAQQVSCLPIDRIDVRGTTLLRADEVRGAVAPFEGRCLGIPQINEALEAITYSYVDKGYITARAYLPEQDIADRVLDISVVEGKLAGIRFNGERRPLWQAMVFPGVIGRATNLREIEQGLEMIRSMPAYEVDMEISAGDEPGESILDIKAEADRLWTARLSANNQGNQTTGRYVSTLDLTYDNMIGMNDSWSLHLGRGVKSYPFAFEDGGANNHSLGLKVAVPYGLWQAKGSFRYAHYVTDTLGPITTVGTDGWTQTASVSLSRVLSRGQDTKTSLTGRIQWQNTVNRIAGIDIIRTSRAMTTARLDLAHERVIWDGRFNARIGVEQGLNWWGAEDASAQPEGTPNAQFTLVDFEMRYAKPWQTSIGGLSYSGSIRGQWSDDLLYGGQRFGVGGVNTVRGAFTTPQNISETTPIDPDDPNSETVTKDYGVFSGPSGLIWRNDLAWTPQLSLPEYLGQLQLYGGLDAGVVYTNKFSNPLVGSAIGVRLVGGRVSADLAWHQFLYIPGLDRLAPGRPRPESGVLLLSVSARY